MRRFQVEQAIRGEKDWPEWAKETHAYRQVLLAKVSTALLSGILDKYSRHLQPQISKTWLQTSLGVLREFNARYDNLAAVTEKDAHEHLDHILATPGPHIKKRGNRSIATRNRSLAVLRKFYRWAIHSAGFPENPFANISSLKEPDIEKIVHLSSHDRDDVLESARKLPDGMAVWLALHTGMRRGEVFRCRWDDIALSRRKLVVPKSKTHKRRAIDIATPLLEFLKVVPAKKRIGRVVAWPEESGRWESVADNLIDTIRASCPDIDPDEIRWNSFRHTFASLLVQNGISLFKVSQWLGNSIDICAKHYAGMSPDWDSDIDV